MPWLPTPAADAQKVLCDLCSEWVTVGAFWGPRQAERDAAVWWPKPEENQGKKDHAWCPRCASATSDRAKQSYESRWIDVEEVMDNLWEKKPPDLVVLGDTAATPHQGDWGPPMAAAAPPPGTSSPSRTDPGPVPPTEPPPPPLRTHEERLAALETVVFQLQHCVAELLERHSSDATTG